MADITGWKDDKYLYSHRLLNKEYYNWVANKIFELKPDSIAEVGGGHILLSILPSYFCKSKTMVDIRPQNKCGDDLLEMWGIDFLQLDVLNYELPFNYDLLICLQMLEHFDNPKSIVERLWAKAKNKIFSVPYNWGPSPGHIQDYITEEVFFSWFPRRQDEYVIIKENSGNERIIGVWKD